MIQLIRNTLKSVKSYQHLFFDLDHTLWDFEKNSVETLKEIFETYNLATHIESADDFIQNYQKINKIMWENYYSNSIDKETLRVARFAMALKTFDIEDLELAKKISDDYLTICPYKGHLFLHTHEVLDYLSRKYTLHLITNGFKEVQHIKIRTSNLEQYFQHIIISEEVGFMKPDEAIFRHAVYLAKAKTKDCMMIGDNPKADIDGATNAGIDTVYFNPEKINLEVESTYEISELIELLSIL